VAPNRKKQGKASKTLATPNDTLKEWGEKLVARKNTHAQKGGTY